MSDTTPSSHDDGEARGAQPGRHERQCLPAAGVRERTATCTETATGLPVELSLCQPTMSLFSSLQGIPDLPRRLLLCQW